MMLAAVLAVATAGVIGVLWKRSRSTTPDPSRCDRCGKARVLLDEESEDPHLDEGQRHEERLGTADYHVWWCGACEHGAVIRHAMTATSRRVTCEKCGHDAVDEVSQTLSPATHVQGGEFVVRISCGSCGHKQRFWRYTPRVRAS
ncbi:hypothetical protein [Pyxidicoccus xibeiensis]|uniref:hypothetical protein n=1 Tax=Pyxidicoccus xibeiensis TaxID=2906759 RepID=UPI0020A77F4E|nr:hypothetical protein [Pyxidicoccus xibeiensis]MCP3137748.1 hypothetical protein [Pyxidicoccus xibeiensis]